MARMKFFLIFVIVFSLAFFSLKITSPSASTITHDFSNAISWNYNGKPTPKTYWSPWLPLVTAGFRYDLGIRFSTGTIAVSDDVRLLCTYNPSQAKAGNTLRLTLEANPKGGSGNTFESSFGVYLPNNLQAGFFNIAGIPDILPWFDLPLDFWELVALVPKVGDSIASAQENIGVNMSSSNPLPVGSLKKYTDTRTLISVSVNDFVSDTKKTQAANKIFSKIPSSKRSTLISAIKLFKDVNNAGAEAFAKNLIEKGIDKLASLGSVSIIGDPQYWIDDAALIVHFRYWVPGKLSGTYPKRFTSRNELFHLDIPLPLFISESDNLHVVVDKIEYEFRIKQVLNFDAGISIAPDINLINKTNVVDFVKTQKTYGENEFKLNIPIQASDAAILDYHICKGVTSATARWASPNIPLKGTVKVFKGTQQIASKSESSLKTSHNVPFAGLAKDTAYTFKMACVDSSGNVYDTTPPITAKTKKDAGRSLTTLTSVSDSKNTYSMTDMQAGSTQTGLNFSWNTSHKSSTEVFLGVAPDVGDNYTAAIKKNTGSIAVGYIGSALGEREMVKTHTISIGDLEPGTTYYYQIVSWTFEDNDPTKNPGVRLGYVGSISTKQGVIPPSRRIRVSCGSRTVKDALVTVKKRSTGTLPLNLVTNSNGVTPEITLEKGKQYDVSVAESIWSVKTDSVMTIPSSATGLLSPYVISPTKKTSPGGYVYNASGGPVSGAQIFVRGKNKTTQTNSQGHYTFENIQPGPCTLDISKSGFRTKSITAAVSPYGLFSAAPVSLSNAATTINISAETDYGNPVKNAAVTIKKSTTTVGTVSTNSQGKATFTHDFGSDGAFNVSFHITPSSPTNISGASTTAQVTGGTTEAVAITCSEDNQAPLISDVQIYGHSQIITKVTTSEKAHGSQIEFITPRGQTTTRPWQNSSSGQGSSSFTHYIGNTVPGTYKIKVRLKDQNDNISESSFHEFTMFGGDMFNLHVSSVSRTGADLKWNRFEGDSAFGGYKISYYPVAHPSQIQELFISDVSRISLKLNDLNENTEYGIAIQATDTGTARLGISKAQSLRFKTISAPPVINDVSLTPDIILAGEPVTIKAKITDPDSSLKGVGILLKKDKDALFKQSISGSSYNLDTSLTFKEPGETTLVLYAYDEKSTSESKIDIKVLAIERPRISWKEAPAVIFAGETYEGLIEILNREAIKKSPVFKIDWGDKQIDDLPVSLKKEPFFPLEHIYKNDGEYTINAVLKYMLDNKIEIDSTPITKNVTVQVKKPTLSLTRDTTRGYGNDQIFHVKILKGSYPLTWTFDFGDGKTLSDSGNVDKDVSHYYFMAARGGLQAILKVVDSKNIEYTKRVSFKINENGTPPPPSASLNNIQSTSQGTRLEPVAGTQGREADPAGRVAAGKQTAASQKETSLQPDIRQKTAAEQTTAQEKKKADVVLSQMTLSKEPVEGKSVTIRFEVENRSELKINDAHLLIKGSDGFSEDKKLTLYPQKIKKTSVRWKPAKAGKQTITAVVECKADTNQKNNKKTLDVEVNAKSTSAKPETASTQKPAETIKPTEKTPAKEKEKTDVALSKMALSKDTIEGKSVTIKFEIKNLSNLKIKDAHLLIKGSDGFSEDKKLTLYPKKTKKVSVRWKPSKPGKQTITAVIKCTSDTNQKNNKKAIDVEVISKSGKSPATSTEKPGSSTKPSGQTPVQEKKKAAIVLSQMTLSKEPVEGKSVTIRFEIENQSEFKIKDAHLLIKGSDGFSEDKKFTLYPKKVKKTSVRWKPAKAGKQTITAVVDCNADTNQKNNKKALNIEVKAKP